MPCAWVGCVLGAVRLVDSDISLVLCAIDKYLVSGSGDFGSSYICGSRFSAVEVFPTLFFVSMLSFLAVPSVWGIKYTNVLSFILVSLPLAAISFGNSVIGAALHLEFKQSSFS